MDDTDDGHEALLVGGGGIDGGDGAYFANAGDDVHAVGALAPIIDGYIGCIGLGRTAAAWLLARCPTQWRSRSRTSVERPRS